MFKFSELRTLHIELTSRCQASCPMCARNYHGGQANENLPVGEISLDEFKLIVNQTVLSQIDYIYFCGNYGDPIMSNDLISIIQYCKDSKEDIQIGVHTNGSARTTEWWKELASVLPKNHSVHFALDGLEDTHHLYRVGTDFNKIIENAKSFISNGGKAEWTYLSFKHNEHQIETAREMAKMLGFAAFNLKATSRFLEKPWFDVLGKNNEVSYKLEPTSEHEIKFIPPEIIKSYKKVVEDATIKCKVLEDKSLYIDAFKQLWPCCWIGAVPYTFSRPSDIINKYQTDQTKNVNELVDSIGGYTSINLMKRSIKEITEDVRWSNVWQEYWDNKQLATCAKTCGVYSEKIMTQPHDQNIKKESFN